MTSVSDFRFQFSDQHFFELYWVHNAQELCLAVPTHFTTFLRTEPTYSVPRKKIMNILTICGSLSFWQWIPTWTSNLCLELKTFRIPSLEHPLHKQRVDRKSVERWRWQWRMWWNNRSVFFSLWLHVFQKQTNSADATWSSVKKQFDELAEHDEDEFISGLLLWDVVSEFSSCSSEKRKLASLATWRQSYVRVDSNAGSLLSNIWHWLIASLFPPNDSDSNGLGLKVFFPRRKTECDLSTQLNNGHLSFCVWSSNFCPLSSSLSSSWSGDPSFSNGEGGVIEITPKSPNPNEKSHFRTHILVCWTEGIFCKELKKWLKDKNWHCNFGEPVGKSDHRRGFVSDSSSTAQMLRGPHSSSLKNSFTLLTSIVGTSNPQQSKCTLTECGMNNRRHLATMHYKLILSWAFSVFPPAALPNGRAP